MRIAYGKLGRSIPLTVGSASNVGGDIEVIQLLNKLLTSPHLSDAEIHLVSRNRNDLEHPRLTNHWAPGGVFDNPPEISRHHDAKFDLYDTWLRDAIMRLPRFDAYVFWLGQHGSSLHPVPAVQEGMKGKYTNPMGSDVLYGYPLVKLANLHGIKPIWLCPDPRNMIKFRDLWDPNQQNILAQHNCSKDNTFYDERDEKLRKGFTRYVASGIELLAVPNDKAGTAPASHRRLFGMLVNEGYSNLGKKGRCELIMRWLANIDYEIFGTWSDVSQAKLGRVIAPVEFAEVHNTLNRWKATMTFPATASGWATAKPWECFRAGTICFRHPDYDSQDHIYGGMDQEMRSFLSPISPEGLQRRLEMLHDDEVYARWAQRQNAYYESAIERLDGGAFNVIDKILATAAQGK